MPTVTITVPADQVEALRTATLTVYQLEADGLQRACDAYLRAGGDATEVDARRAALLAVDALLRHLGGSSAPRAGGAPRTVTAPVALVDEVVHAALLEGVERLDDGARSWQAGADVAVLRSRLAHVGALVDLLTAARAS